MKKMNWILKREKQSLILLMHADFIFDNSVHSIDCEIDWIENILKQFKEPSVSFPQPDRKKQTKS